MDIAIFGAGKQAFGAIHYLLHIRNNSNDKILVIDKDNTRLENIKLKFANDDRLSFLKADYRDIDDKLSNCDVIFNSLPYSENLEATKIAIKNKCNLVDLGGNCNIVQQQLNLFDEAVSAGVTIIPDCGLAPGLSNILAYNMFKKSGVIESIEIYVGGIPLDNDNMFKYKRTFSTEGLINEYTQKAEIIENGQFKIVDSMLDVEDFQFSNLFDGGMELESFTTSGGLSTLARDLHGKLKNLKYKTLRHKGHADVIKLMSRLNGGLDSSLIDNFIPECDCGDQILMLIVCYSKDFVFKYKMHKISRNLDLTAMIECTSFPAVITMLAIDGSKHGVFTPHNFIDGDLMISELSKCGIHINEYFHLYPNNVLMEI